MNPQHYCHGFWELQGEGFEPSKAKPADLQSAPFGRSGTPAHIEIYYITFNKSCQYFLSI